MKQYHDLLRYILKHGTEKSDRTGTGTTSVFGYQMRFDLTEGFPLVTTKRVHMKSVIHELLWFLKGDTNIRYLNDNGVHIWDEWADKDGDLGPIYSRQWRNWEGPSRGRHYEDDENRIWGEEIDQIAEVIKQIKINPDSRRHIVTAWQPGELKKMKLPPCHLLFQFYVVNGKLSCQLYQRSADAFLGVPFNIASYALLTQMIAQVCRLEVGEFIHTFGDLHIYSNHMAQVEEQLSRELRPLPRMFLNPGVDSIDDFQYGDFNLKWYDPHPAIKAQVAV